MEVYDRPSSRRVDAESVTTYSLSDPATIENPSSVSPALTTHPVLRRLALLETPCQQECKESSVPQVRVPDRKGRAIYSNRRRQLSHSSLPRCDWPADLRADNRS